LQSLKGYLLSKINVHISRFNGMQLTEIYVRPHRLSNSAQSYADVVLM